MKRKELLLIPYVMRLGLGLSLVLFVLTKLGEFLEILPYAETLWQAGMMVLILTPIARVGVMGVFYFSQKDWTAFICSLGVLFTILGGLLVALL
jgi:uncharacterized membrane protein